jgi:hypothetical protein
MQRTTVQVLVLVEVVSNGKPFQRDTREHTLASDHETISARVRGSVSERMTDTRLGSYRRSQSEFDTAVVSFRADYRCMTLSPNGHFRPLI